MAADAGRRVTAPELFAMGMEARAAGRTDQAEAWFRALEARGELAAAVGRHVAELEAAGRYDAAEAALRLALDRRPDDRDLACTLGRHRLREGDFAEGWALMEAREIEISADLRGRPQLSLPEWRGEPVGSLLVFAEQGLGDQIQFARFAPLLLARGVRVALACAPPLIPLFAPVLASLGVPLIPTVRGAGLPRCDAWTMLMSLPHRLGTTLETIPPPLALSAGSEGGGVGVGLVTHGNPRHLNDRNRSLPAEIGAALRARPGMVSLHPEDTGATDFAQTARIVGGLAAVVTVDTSVAHLAGSLGKPCRLLLPFTPDWRWLRARDDTPWYPSMRLYRQPRPGDWGPAIEAALRDLPAP